MIINKLKLLFIIFLIAIGGSCTRLSDKDGIDTSYLNSNAYQYFKKQIAKERHNRIQHKVKFKDLVNGLAGDLISNIRENKSIPRLTASMLISNEQVVDILEKEKGWKPLAAETQNKFHPDYKYAVVGKYAFENDVLLFFLLKKGAIYRDAILMLATSREGSLADIRAIASYQKNITSQQLSTVYIDSPNKISVDIEQTLFYPINQTDDYIFRYKKRYKISEDGHILNLSKQ